MAKKDTITNILALTKKLGRLEMSHYELERALENYENPNKKIFDLIKAGDLLRIQRGHYRLNQELTDIPPASEIVAQMLHGPSYLSLEWALAHYGLIPERVETITSVTLKRKRILHTPVGTFEYQHLTPSKYALGFTQEKLRKNSYLIATPLKALIDLIYFRVSKNQKLSQDEIEELLMKDYRVDGPSLRKRTNRKDILSLKAAYRRSLTIVSVLDWMLNPTFRGERK
jgi:predicted transcriptional regulator of viral defense system